MVALAAKSHRFVGTLSREVRNSDHDLCRTALIQRACVMGMEAMTGTSYESHRRITLEDGTYSLR